MSPQTIFLEVLNLVRLTPPVSYPDGCGGPDAVAAAKTARVRMESARRQGKLTWYQLLRERVYDTFSMESEDELRDDLIQTMAVCMQWVTEIDSRI